MLQLTDAICIPVVERGISAPFDAKVLPITPVVNVNNTSAACFKN